MTWRATFAVVVRPWLWATAAVQLARMAPRGWWRRWPPIPAPDPEYVRFRLVTFYGDPDRAPDGVDVVRWLTWCRSERHALR
jgi:hypothetical protein